jgi:hypothetical protein
LSKSMGLGVHATNRIAPCVHTRFPSFGWGRMIGNIDARGCYSTPLANSESNQIIGFLINTLPKSI